MCESCFNVSQTITLITPGTFDKRQNINTQTHKMEIKHVVKMEIVLLSFQLYSPTLSAYLFSQLCKTVVLTFWQQLWEDSLLSTQVNVSYIAAIQSVQHMLSSVLIPLNQRQQKFKINNKGEVHFQGCSWCHWYRSNQNTVSKIIVQKMT